jgi:hypothetical protein
VVKDCGAVKLITRQSRAEVKNAWTYTATPLVASWLGALLSTTTSLTLYFNSFQRIFYASILEPDMMIAQEDFKVVFTLRA